MLAFYDVVFSSNPSINFTAEDNICWQFFVYGKFRIAESDIFEFVYTFIHFIDEIACEGKANAELLEIYCKILV